MVHWVGKESRPFGLLVADSLGGLIPDALCTLMRSYSVMQQDRRTSRHLIEQKNTSFFPWAFYALSRLEGSVKLYGIS